MKLSIGITTQFIVKVIQCICVYNVLCIIMLCIYIMSEIDYNFNLVSLKQSYTQFLFLFST